MRLLRLTILLFALSPFCSLRAQSFAPEWRDLGAILDRVADVERSIRQATVLDAAGSCGGRLTLTSGTAVTTSDVTGATTVYFTPFQGSRIALYNGTIWTLYLFSEVSLALGTLSNATNYDVFAYDSAGSVALELSAAWTNGTTRADTISLQDGVYVKTSSTTRRYLGTFQTTATTTTEDSQAKRYLWNYCNRVPRNMVVSESTISWNYTTAAWRSSNNSTSNRLAFVIGTADVMVQARALSVVTNTTVALSSGVGIDSTTANSATIYGGFGNAMSGSYNQAWCVYSGYPGVGVHYAQWLEYGDIGGVFYGANESSSTMATGIEGSLDG